MKEYRTNEELINYLSSKGVIIANKEEALQKIERYTYYSIVNTYKSIFKGEDGNYLDIDKYGFVPPFVLVKILTFGVASSYYGLLKQSDRQAIAKYFKISDKLLKQILKNLTTIRNVAAHSDRLYNYTSKFYLSFKLIDKEYIKSDNITNLYMVIRCMEKLLTTEQYDALYNSIIKEIETLDKKLNSISVDKVMNIMGFPMNIVDNYVNSTIKQVSACFIFLYNFIYIE